MGVLYDVCQTSSESFKNFMSGMFFKDSASSTKNQNGGKSHMTNQLYRLKLEIASDVDSAYQISCKSIFNFMRRRFLKVLAYFSKIKMAAKPRDLSSLWAQT